jgi:nucleoside-diphosphate-sugar epimerase
MTGATSAEGEERKMAETVLVTGGTGFVAGWCLAELLRRGYRVRTTVRDLGKEAGVRAAVGGQVDAEERLAVFAADLMADQGWDAALAGCDYVLHVASPMGNRAGDDPGALIEPAREGALRVLRAAVRAGVKRVVLTSSTAASSPPLTDPDSENDERVWTDPDTAGSPYRQSKVLAERAAWDFMARDGGATELTTVLPTAILGPILTTEGLGSVMVVGAMLQGRMPGLPRRGFNVIDVRDLAEAHIGAMTSPAAAGERFIASSDFLWLADIARILRSALPDRARAIPTRVLPNFVVKLAASRNPALRAMVPGLGRRHTFSSAKAQRVFDWTPRPAAETVVDCAASLIARAVV